MKKVVFADNWQSFFTRYGLKSFDDFFAIQADEQVLKASKRYVNSFTLGQQADKKTFFIKRFSYSHLKDIFFALYNFGSFLSQAACEWKNSHYLIEKGFSTYKPICYGEHTWRGIERKSFFVTEKIQGQCLTEFVAENFAKLNQSQKEKIIASLGKTIRKIHDAQISLPDLYIWHIFINEKQAGEYEFAIIDLHRMKQKNNLNERIRNLARFDYSLLAEYFDDKLRQLLIQSYIGDNHINGMDCLAEKVRLYSSKISKRRNQKPYILG